MEMLAVQRLGLKSGYGLYDLASAILDRIPLSVLYRMTRFGHDLGYWLSFVAGWRIIWILHEYYESGESIQRREGNAIGAAWASIKGYLFVMVGAAVAIPLDMVMAFVGWGTLHGVYPVKVFMMVVVLANLVFNLLVPVVLMALFKVVDVVAGWAGQAGQWLWRMVRPWVRT